MMTQRIARKIVAVSGFGLRATDYGTNVLERFSRSLSREAL